jgi:hypothetical protein
MKNAHVGTAALGCPSAQESSAAAFQKKRNARNAFTALRAFIA